MTKNKGEDMARTDGKTPRGFSAHIVFGEEDSRRVADGRFAEMENSYVTYTYGTEAELQAFLDGVDAASGWMEHVVIDPETKRRVDRSSKRRKARAGEAVR